MCIILNSAVLVFNWMQYMVPGTFPNFAPAPAPAPGTVPPQYASAQNFIWPPKPTTETCTPANFYFGLFVYILSRLGMHMLINPQLSF